MNIPAPRQIYYALCERFEWPTENDPMELCLHPLHESDDNFAILSLIMIRWRYISWTTLLPPKITTCRQGEVTAGGARGGRLPAAVPEAQQRGARPWPLLIFRCGEAVVLNKGLLVNRVLPRKRMMVESWVSQSQRRNIVFSVFVDCLSFCALFCLLVVLLFGVFLRDCQRQIDVIRHRSCGGEGDGKWSECWVEVMVFSVRYWDKVGRIWELGTTVLSIRHRQNENVCVFCFFEELWWGLRVHSALCWWCCALCWMLG